MKRIGYTSLATLALTTGLAAFAFATPVPNSAVISTRLFNDCPTSILSSTNNYPALVSITDVMNPSCVGFANRHAFSFSEDGTTPSLSSTARTSSSAPTSRSPAADSVRAVSASARGGRS